MKHLARQTATLALIAIVATACGAANPAVAPSVAPAAATPATTYEAFDAAFCGSFTALIRAVGNPDVNSPSKLSKVLDDAVAAGDALAGEQAARAMLDELAAGRRQAAIAAGWQPAAGMMAQMDRLLAAFEEMTIAKRAAAARTPGAIDPTKAFTAAGGVAAWTGVLGGLQALPIPNGAVTRDCPALRGQA
ncbi:MAG: hypothetical protein ABIQ76_11890 [Candidatus Limnocylindrales bacterium]